MEDTRKDQAGTMQADVQSVISKKRVKPRRLKESALAAGLQAFEALESSDLAIRPVQPTARTLVQEGIESIMRARARGVPLLRIYSDARKAAGLRISFQTFAGYVCEISKERGIKLEKPKAKPKAEAAPQARTIPEPAPVVAGPEPVIEQAPTWNCEECSTTAKLDEYKGKKYYECPKCRVCYTADENGSITTTRFTG